MALWASGCLKECDWGRQQLAAVPWLWREGCRNAAIRQRPNQRRDRDKNETDMRKKDPEEERIFKGGAEVETAAVWPTLLPPVHTQLQVH